MVLRSTRWFHHFELKHVSEWLPLHWVVSVLAKWLAKKVECSVNNSKTSSLDDLRCVCDIQHLIITTIRKQLIWQADITAREDNQQLPNPAALSSKLRPVSDMQQSWATNMCNKVRNNQISSSALLITSMLSYCNTNQQLTRKQTIDQSQVGDRARNCWRTEMFYI